MLPNGRFADDVHLELEPEAANVRRVAGSAAQVPVRDWSDSFRPALLTSGPAPVLTD